MSDGSSVVLGSSFRRRSGFGKSLEDLWFLVRRRCHISVRATFSVAFSEGLFFPSRVTGAYQLTRGSTTFWSGKSSTGSCIGPRGSWPRFCKPSRFVRRDSVLRGSAVVGSLGNKFGTLEVLVFPIGFLGPCKPIEQHCLPLQVVGKDE